MRKDCFLTIQTSEKECSTGGLRKPASRFHSVLSLSSLKKTSDVIQGLKGSIKQ